MTEHPHSWKTVGEAGAALATRTGAAASAPLSRSRLALAGVHVHLLVAVSAEHGAAPVELALALGGAADPGRVVTPAAAHHLAAIHAAGCPVADTPPSPHRP